MDVAVVLLRLEPEHYVSSPDPVWLVLREAEGKVDEQVEGATEANKHNGGLGGVKTYVGEVKYAGRWVSKNF